MARSQAERDRIAAWWHLRRMERQLQGIQAQIAALATGRDTAEQAAHPAHYPPHAPTATQREELAHWQRHLADLRREMAVVHQRAYPQRSRDENERTA